MPNEQTKSKTVKVTISVSQAKIEKLVMDTLEKDHEQLDLVLQSNMNSIIGNKLNAIFWQDETRDKLETVVKNYVEKKIQELLDVDSEEAKALKGTIDKKLMERVMAGIMRL